LAFNDVKRRNPTGTYPDDFGERRGRFPMRCRAGEEQHLQRQLLLGPRADEALPLVKRRLDACDEFRVTEEVVRTDNRGRIV
jgi:hypothetical protein